METAKCLTDLDAAIRIQSLHCCVTSSKTLSSQNTGEGGIWHLTLNPQVPDMPYLVESGVLRLCRSIGRCSRKSPMPKPFIRTPET